MPKKRTKKQKTRATYHYAFPAGKSFVGLEGEASPVQSQVISSTLYQYDPKYLIQDLFKTVLITLLMIVIELGLYFYLK